MICNNVDIKIIIPVGKDTEKAEVEEILVAQTQYLIELWRNVLATYKAQGITVPSVAFKNPFKKKEALTQYQQDTKDLLNFCLAEMPTANPVKQRSAIHTLLEMGFSKEELIERFKKNQEGYPMTTWLTVVYWVKQDKPKPTSDETFKPVSEQEREDIMERIKGYGK